MGDTIFSRIIRREIPADIVHEDDEVLGFRDVSPQAPTHVLFIPKREIPTLNDLRPDDATLVGKLVMAATAYAKAQGLAENGYRCVINCNRRSITSICICWQVGRCIGRRADQLRSFPITRMAPSSRHANGDRMPAPRTGHTASSLCVR